MFIISCEKDNSYCQVRDNDVIQDDDVQPGTDDTVMFYYNKKICYGKIVFYSANDDEVDAKLVEIIKPKNKKRDVIKSNKKMEPLDGKCRTGQKRDSSKISPKKDDKTSHQLETPAKKVNKLSQKTGPKNLKNKPEPLKKDSPVNDDYKIRYLELQKQMDDEKKKPTSVKNKRPGPVKKSKGNNDSLSSTTESIDSSSDDPIMDNSKSDVESDHESISDKNDKEQEHIEDVVETKVEKKSLADEKEKEKNSVSEGEIADLPIKNNLDNKSKDNESKTDEETEQPGCYDENIQLLGRNHSEKMIEIEPNIFCVKKKLNLGHDSGEATVLARCLMEGIFKQEELLRCTLTGQAARAQGPEKNKQNVEPLHHAAKKAIIDYALNYSKVHGWTKKMKNGESIPYSVGDIKRSMTQRIGEIKREHEKNLQMKPPTAP